MTYNRSQVVADTKWYSFKNGGVYRVVRIIEAKNDPDTVLVEIQSINSLKYYFYSLIEFLDGQFQPME